MESLANTLLPILSCNRSSPCTTFNSTTPILASRHSFVIVTLVSAAVAFGLGTLFRLKKSQRSFAMCASMFQNSNSLPIALIQVSIRERGQMCEVESGSRLTSWVGVATASSPSSSRFLV
jgi:predicted permease